MREHFSSFTFQESKLTTQIWLFAIALWLVVVTCAIASICAQPFGKRQRAVWIMLVVCVPILGLLAYLPFSIRRDELPTAFLIRGSSKDKKKSNRRTLSSKNSSN
jgi:uncharacterized membrane protein YhaH (DUF805 family)